MRCALLIVLMLLCGCDSANSRRVPVSKVISEKLAATEQRAIRSRAESVYYLIAEDGTMVEVSLKEYAKSKVGQSFESSQWK